MGGTAGDDEVITIVTAAEVDANHGFVIGEAAGGGLGHGRIDQAEISDDAGNADATEGCAACVAEEPTTSAEDGFAILIKSGHGELWFSAGW